MHPGLLLSSLLLVACGSEPAPLPVGSSGAGPATGGGGGGGVSGAIVTGGNAGSAGSMAGGGGASGGDGAAGSAGTGTSGSGGVGGTPMDGFTDPGTELDGDFVLSPPYQASPLNSPMGAGFGKQISFVMESADSTIYPGRNGPYSRTVWLYVPSKYVAGSKVPFMVVQDGYFALWYGNLLPHDPNPNGPNLPGTANLPLIIENLNAQGKLPPLAVLFVDNGGGDGGNSQRGLEYDTVSGKFAEFVQTEVLPRAAMEAQEQLQLNLVFSDDPRSRGTLGGSSGGAASFSMAWFHPEYFTRVISFSGTFVRQASPEDPMYPHGCWSYHDFDPFDAAMPNGVIMKEPTPKPLRIWLEVGENDLGADGGPGTYRDFPLANQRMAAALKAKGYHYHFDYANGAGHVDGNVVAQTLPAALEWVWRGHPLE